MRVVVTGGGGFIGSHVSEEFVFRGDEVRVVDNFATGYRENVPDGAELAEGEVTDRHFMAKALDGAEIVFHLAAHRAVLRSVRDPLATDYANTHGTLTLLGAALHAGVRRVVYASSSSVYGGAEQLPTPETAPTLPRSPYAVSKLAGEHYCRVFSQLHGLETASLRYFNVFGPRQRPDSAYAAVIPLFIEALLRNERPTVHGDGLQSRSFCYVSDVVAANVAAATAPPSACDGRAYNIGGSERKNLLELLALVGDLLGVQPDPVFAPPRAGDVRHTSADIALAAEMLGFRPTVTVAEGMARTLAWMRARAQA